MDKYEEYLKEHIGLYTQDLKDANSFSLKTTYSNIIKVLNDALIQYQQFKKEEDDGKKKLLDTFENYYQFKKEKSNETY